MKWSRRWNTLQICPCWDSNSGGSDPWSNVLKVTYWTWSDKVELALLIVWVMRDWLIGCTASACETGDSAQETRTQPLTLWNISTPGVLPCVMFLCRWELTKSPWWYTIFVNTIILMLCTRSNVCSKRIFLSNRKMAYKSMTAKMAK